MTSANGVHMVSLRLDLPSLLAAGFARRLPQRSADTGYLTHCVLAELFGDLAPKPFAILDDRGRHVSVLGYAGTEATSLHERAQAYASPTVYSACRWDQLASKPMPARWPTASAVGFEARVCPTVRMDEESPLHRKGAEVDAFLAKCWAAGNAPGAVDREATYRDWFQRHLERAGGARAVEVRLTRFVLQGLVRRTQGPERKSALCERPDATLAGTLEITDSDAFMSMLRRGVGRHRAFGFGMLLLRPIRGPC